MAINRSFKGAVMPPGGCPVKSWHMPDGTKASNKPKDGQTWTKFDTYGQPLETWQWDDFYEQWFNVSSGKPTKHNTKTFVIPQGIDSIPIEINFEGYGLGIDWPLKCECGSEKCGSDKHSSWCPKHTT